MRLQAQTASIDVRYGDRFRVGPHLFQCGDLLVPGEWESLVSAWRKTPCGRKGCWVYSDPPWSGPNLRYWRTYAGYDAGVQDFRRFIERFVECAGQLKPCAAYVEQSVHDPNTLILAAARCDDWPHLAGRWMVRYGNKRADGTRLPNVLLRFAAEPTSADPTEMHGEAMTRHVFEREPAANAGLPVVDPCVGLGMTVRMAHARGLAVLGNELNPQRLGRTLGWLAKRGVEVERL